MKRLIALVLTGLALGTLLIATPSARASLAIPAWRPERLTHLGNAMQVLVVTADGWRSTSGTARLFERRNGQWVQELSAIPARLGWNGLVPGRFRVQDTGTTPAGTYRLAYAFGYLPNPGTALPYRRVSSGSWWPNDPRDPATYNVWQMGRPLLASWQAARAEQLIKWLPQYDYGIAIGFNLPAGPYRYVGGETLAKEPANLRAGGGIFIHVSSTGPTAGCVSLPAPALVKVLQLLRPSENPQIVIGPLSAIDSL